MLALKKKREAEAKAKAAAAEAAAAKAGSSSDGGGEAAAVQTPATTGEQQQQQQQQQQEQGMSLFGIGGVQRTNGKGERVKKRTPGELRIQNDISELDGGKVATIDFPNPNDLTKFTVTVKPDTGYWAGATYLFTIDIPPSYPHSPPKVECKTRIYHPNIDLQGKVCLNILRDEWKPVLDINAVIYGLIYLFYEPNPDDPLNHKAADLLRHDKQQFHKLVAKTLRGGIMEGVQFDRLV